MAAFRHRIPHAGFREHGCTRVFCATWPCTASLKIPCTRWMRRGGLPLTASAAFAVEASGTGTAEEMTPAKPMCGLCYSCKASEEPCSESTSHAYIENQAVSSNSAKTSRCRRLAAYCLLCSSVFGIGLQKTAILWPLPCAALRGNCTVRGSGPDN